MIKDFMDPIIEKRKEKNLEDDYGIEEYWNNMIKILSQNVFQTITYLE